MGYNDGSITNGYFPGDGGDSGIDQSNSTATATAKTEAVLDLSGVSGTTAAELPKDAISAIEKAGLDLTVKLPAGTITLDEKAAVSVAGQATGDALNIELKQTAASSLSSEQQKAVKSGDLVLDISIYSGAAKISSFDGALTVQLSYTGALPVAVWYLNDAGALEKLESSYQNGVLRFVLSHLSLYVVGQDSAWVNPFTDVAPGAWYYDAVSFIAQKGITSGTTATTFSPAASLTRGQFITLLMRAYEIKADEASADNFSDAGDTYYTGYLAAAKRLGISNGVGDNGFAPEQAITRQEMFTLLYNALKALDQLPQGDSGKTLTDFSDSGEIASWATEAMSALVKSGTVSGDAGLLAPASGSTRAPMAQVLYNLLGK